MSDPLYWSPLHTALERRTTGGDGILLILAPFAKLSAVKYIHSVLKQSHPIKIVSRWRANDLLSGVTDADIYPFLRDNGSELYINKDLHAKLFVFASNDAFLTSSNLTLAGLGLSSEPNLEVGAFLRLHQKDWDALFEIIAASRRVDEAVYIRLQSFLAGQPKRPPIPELPLEDELLFGPPKRFTIASLPATPTPERLADFYFQRGRINFTAEETRRALHDVFVFKIPPGLDEDRFRRTLNEHFRQSAFVSSFVEFLRSQSSLRFGAVKEWMHSLCEDVPLPYKWELNENVRILYDWLAHFYPEISWGRPNFSQVIYWKG